MPEPQEGLPLHDVFWYMTRETRFSGGSEVPEVNFLIFCGANCNLGQYFPEVLLEIVFLVASLNQKQSSYYISYGYYATSATPEPDTR